MAATFCGRCGGTIPATATFCPKCGAPRAQAAAAAPPPPAGPPPPPTAAPYAYAYAYAPASPAQVAGTVPHKTGSGLLWVLAGGGILFFMVCLGAIAILIGRSVTVSCTGAGCTRPPAKPPLGAPHHYTNAAGFSIDYYDHPELGDHLQVQADNKAIAWHLVTRSGNWPYVVTGEKANGRNADQIVDQLQQANFPDATPLYSPPGVTFGVTPGTAKIYNATISPGNGQSIVARVVVAVAVKNNVAVELIAVGPYIKSTQDDGHPNPSNTFITQLADEPLKGITWEGDPPL